MKKRKKALITGITGQDGSYLAEFLLQKKYIVYGMVRRSSMPNTQRIDHILAKSRFEESSENKIRREYGDLSSSAQIQNLIKRIKPDEIYNLAAQSHVRISFDVPQFTVQTNALGVLNLLESVKINAPNAKIYQASSSEMFGNSRDADNMQRETTPMHPVSPYGCAKLFSYSLIRNYRKAFKLFASNGILFNHESPRRGPTFVTKKIIQGLVRIRNGFQKKLTLGNLYAIRDWGHAKDYATSMWKILQFKKPDDWVIATNKETTVKDFINKVAKKLDIKLIWRGKGENEKGIDQESKKIIIEIDKKYFRPTEVDFLRGNYSKARKQLKWTPSTTTDKLIDDIDGESIDESVNLDGTGNGYRLSFNQLNNEYSNASIDLINIEHGIPQISFDLQA